MGIGDRGGWEEWVGDGGGWEEWVGDGGGWEEWVGDGGGWEEWVGDRGGWEEIGSCASRSISMVNFAESTKFLCRSSQQLSQCALCECSPSHNVTAGYLVQLFLL